MKNNLHFKLLSFATVAVASAIAVTAAHAAPKEVTLVRKGVAQAAIYAAPDVMAADKPVDYYGPEQPRTLELNRQRLRESVKDLSRYLQKKSGATVEVFTTAPAAKDKRVPIYIGALASTKFGPVTKKAAYGQGFRVVVNKNGIGLLGETDESTSYAIYEVLHRLGCRWYIPSELGEEIPTAKTIALPVMDFAGAPGTWYRNIWYAEADFARRNRMGGFPIAAGHALEYYITEEQRKAHPEWRAIIGGQPHGSRLKWSNPGLQQAVADAVIAQLDKAYIPSISLSPVDGGEFDESDDKAWDAGDIDPVMNGPSVTDRYIKFCNIIAEKVTKKYPDVKLGFLAYVNYTQAPIREKLHPALVPMIAPINYCRAHAMTDNCPSRPIIKGILEGWAKASDAQAYYNYMFNLAEYSAPYPMMHQMKEELPIIYKNNVKYWMPEGVPNNETILPGLYLTIRKAWNPNESSDAILDEFFTRYYGNASTPMRRYWTMIDDQWWKVDEHAGGGWDYRRRFTPDFMKRTRVVMDEALSAAKTANEYRRVAIHEASWKQFERFMQMEWDLNEGRLDKLADQSRQWKRSQLHLGDEYQKQNAFGKIYWDPDTASGRLFRLFFEPAFMDATRIHSDFIIASSPLREWKYQQDKEKAGEAQGWSTVEFADGAWKTTDVGTDTWDALGFKNYYGAVWYRSTVAVSPAPAGKKVFLWVSRSDGDVKVWVNGKLAPFINEKGVASDEFKNGYVVPISFDITAAVKPGAPNQITIRGTRVFINELGTGGLMGPVYIYREK